MFSIEDFLNQGDTNLQLQDFSDQLDDHCFINQDFADFEILDTSSKVSDLNSALGDTNMNLDLKELLANVLAGEPLENISLFNADAVSPAIPSTELSYNLNATLEEEAFLIETCVPSSQTPETSTACVVTLPENDSFEVAEVSSTTNVLFDLMDEGISLSSSLGEDDAPQRSEGSEITESEAAKKYLQMRRKNNIASQRSRKIRKQKNSNMSERLKELEKENKELSSLADQLEKEKNTLQELLMRIIAKKS